MNEEKKVPSEEGKTKEQSSEGVNSGNDKNKSDEALSNVPEHLRKKDRSELVKMYRNLEKKLGEQSAEVKGARETKKQVSSLLNSIYADPKRVSTVQKWIQQYYGYQTDNNDKKRETDSSNESGDGTSDKTARNQSDDTRRTLQDQIFADFYKKHGVDKLSKEERKQEQTKLAVSFANMVDPSGKKTMAQILDSMPLNTLGSQLENAYVIANKDKFMSKLNKDSAAAAENRRASIGSFSSESGGDSEVRLTAKEREVAKKIGVSPEAYAKNKARIEKELSSV